MSKKFKDFLNQSAKPKTPEPAEEGIVVDGAFVCTTCYYQCDEAHWFPNRNLLIWTCLDEHESRIKDFKGF